MTAFKRALLYISRKKGKTILLLLIFFVVSTLILTGMTINNAAGTAALRLRESIGGYFKVSGKLGAGDVDDALIGEIAGTDGIKSFNAMDTLYLTMPDLMLKPARFTGEGGSKARLARVLSNTDSSLHEYFLLDILTLAEGRHVTPGDSASAMISRGLADMNGLAPGGHITASVTDDVISVTEAKGNTFEFEIVGIFDEADAKEPGALTPECDLPANFIFIDQNSGNAVKDQLSGGNAESYTGGAAFFAADPKELPSIVNSVRSGLGDGLDSLELTENNTAYEKSMAPLERLDGATKIMVAAIAVAGAVIISLLLLMWTRDRVHEAGVLMSAGIRKSGIFLQQLLECLLVFIVAFAIAWAVSIPVSSLIGGMMYGSAPAVQPAAHTEEFTAYTGEVIDFGQLEHDAEFLIRPSAAAVLTAGGIGLALAAASVGLAFLIILRKKPKDLLTIME